LGDLEDRDEALRRLIGLPEPPEAPRALEEREAIELAVLEFQDLLVLFERRGVVVLAVEERLAARHVGVGDEARAREVLEDVIEAVERLVLLALLGGEETVDVE